MLVKKIKDAYPDAIEVNPFIGDFFPSFFFDREFFAVSRQDGEKRKVWIKEIYKDKSTKQQSLIFEDKKGSIYAIRYSFSNGTFFNYFPGMGDAYCTRPGAKKTWDVICLMPEEKFELDEADIAFNRHRKAIYTQLVCVNGGIKKLGTFESYAAARRAEEDFMARYNAQFPLWGRIKKFFKFW